MWHLKLLCLTTPVSLLIVVNLNCLSYQKLSWRSKNQIVKQSGDTTALLYDWIAVVLLLQRRASSCMFLQAHWGSCAPQSAQMHWAGSLGCRRKDRGMLLGWEKAVFQYLHCCSSQVRTSEMERVCYEKSQSKTNGLPFVTVPEAMHTSWVKQKRILHWMLHVVPWLTWEGLFQGLPSSHIIGASWLLHCWGLL